MATCPLLRRGKRKEKNGDADTTGRKSSRHGWRNIAVIDALQGLERLLLDWEAGDSEDIHVN